MKAVSKFVLFVGVSGIGLLLCGKMFVDDSASSNSQLEQWDSLTAQDSDAPIEKPGVISAAPDSFAWQSSRLESNDEIETTVSTSSWISSPAETLNVNGPSFVGSTGNEPNSDEESNDNAAEINDMPHIREVGTASTMPGRRPMIKSLPLVEDDAEQNSSQKGELVESNSINGQGQNVAKVKNPFFNNRSNDLDANHESVVSNGSDDATTSMVESIRQRQGIKVTNRFVTQSETGEEDIVHSEIATPESSSSKFAPVVEPRRSIERMAENPVNRHTTNSESSLSAPVNNDFRPALTPTQTADAPAFDPPTIRNEVSLDSIPSPSAINKTTTVIETRSPEALQSPAGIEREARVAASSQRRRASPVVDERARQHIEYGNSLARRGAVFAARQEFIQSLRLIADSHDMATQSRIHTSQLATGLQALAESDDFVAVDSEQQLQMDVRSIVETHTTRLIDPKLASEISPIQAMQRYYEYAADQIGQSVGESQVASQALHSMGKLLTTAARFDVSGKPMDRTKAMVMHQVALSADSGNYLSANELGVLLAGNGRWRQAAELFGESLKIKQTATTWSNLAMAHQQIARISSNPEEQTEQLELASLARNESHILSGGSVATHVIPQEWTSSNEFNASAAMPELVPEMMNGDRLQNEATVAEKPESKHKLLNKVKSWF